jgi:hypothetical protein
MEKEKNTLKPKEQIGKGFNNEHWQKVKKARLSPPISFRADIGDYNEFNELIAENKLDKQESLRGMFSGYMRGEVPSVKLDLIVQELTLKDERINQLEEKLLKTIKFLEEHKSQLIDGGAAKDSVIVMSINAQIEQIKKDLKL